MTLFHLGNCLVLAYAPYFILYKYSGLSENNAFWRCVKAGGAYFVTQLCKLFIMAVLFPVSEDINQTVTDELMQCTADLFDFVGIYLCLSRVLAKGEMKITALAVGWGTAEIIGTRLIPLWIGARGTEFDWQYIQESFGANVNLVNHMTVAALLWIWSRNDAKKLHLLSAVVFLGLLSYKSALLHILEIAFRLNAWMLVTCDIAVSSTIALCTLNFYQQTANKL